MAVFFISRQHHSFLLYSILAPNTIPMLAQFYPCECINGLSESCTDQSSSVADCVFGNGVQQVVKKGVMSTTMDKKRKSRGGVSSTNNDQIRGGREVKCKKQRRRRNLMEENEGNKAKSDYKKDLEEAPTGFIHVRARRGQATDSHSLAERVRREKISERMKVLQALVPGCDKVTGKALMLDEIINYVQSLQHQVEFLSMKLASLNPTLYDFGMDWDAPMISPESLNKLLPSTLLSNVGKYNSALPMTSFDAIPASINPHLP